ncbi:MAG: FAD/NAD(P)-binding protein [Halorubrum sp.]
MCAETDPPAAGETDPSTAAGLDTTVTIVGGGVHGVHIAVRLLQMEVVQPHELRIVDPDGLLDALRRKCRQCGMESFRSPHVHHVDADPFSLRTFARAHGREDELRESAGGGDRPTVPLFFDHADRVCTEYDLDRRHVTARVTAVDPRDSTVEVTTTRGRFSTDWCILAVGHGSAFTEPTWMNDRSSDAISHVWERSFDPAAIDTGAAVGVVGGGVTAAQLATTLATPAGRTVTLFARSPFDVAVREADTEWMHASSVADRLGEHPPGSRTRAALVADARRDGSIPPHVFSRLERALDHGSVVLERSPLDAVTNAGGTAVVTCANGCAYCLHALVCATGYDSPYRAEPLRSVADRPTLRTGYDGAPRLDDDTLRWVRTDGTRSRVAVSGAAARQTLGPLAGNIVGARHAAVRIAAGLASALDADTRGHPD